MSFHVVRDLVADFATIRDSASEVVSLALSGGIATGSTNVICSKLGNLVSLEIIGTSNGSMLPVAIILSTLPVQFRPLNEIVQPIIIENNGATAVGQLTITTAGVILIGTPSTASFPASSPGPFTNAAAGGFLTTAVTFIGA